VFAIIFTQWGKNKKSDDPDKDFQEEWGNLGHSFLSLMQILVLLLKRIGNCKKRKGIDQATLTLESKTVFWGRVLGGFTIVFSLILGGKRH